MRKCQLTEEQTGGHEFYWTVDSDSNQWVEFLGTDFVSILVAAISRYLLQIRCVVAAMKFSLFGLTPNDFWTSASCVNKILKPRPRFQFFHSETYENDFLSLEETRFYIADVISFYHVLAYAFFKSYVLCLSRASTLDSWLGMKITATATVHSHRLFLITYICGQETKRLPFHITHYTFLQS